MSHIISATAVSRDLSGYLNKVHYQGQSFEIKRGKEIIARLIPFTNQKTNMTVHALVQLMANIPTLDEDDAESFSKTIDTIRSQMHHENNPWE